MTFRSAGNAIKADTVAEWLSLTVLKEMEGGPSSTGLAASSVPVGRLLRHA